MLRRSLIAGAAAVPFLRKAARAARTPGVLRFGLSSYPPTLAPWQNAGTAAGTVQLIMNRGLVSYAPDGSLQGELAESWGRDGDAWVFKLREARFHDGTPVRAEDVKWNIEQVAGEKSTAYLRAQFQGAERIETPDARTVRLVMRTPNATIPLLLATFFMPMVKPGTTGSGGQPVGAGPFVLKVAERGVGLEFEANPHYYKPGLPKLRGIRATAYADENLRVAALQAGDLDLIEYVPWQNMAAIEADPKLRLDATDGPYMYLVFNGKAGPFADARVRRAVAHAIKREEIVRAAFFGRGKPLEGLPVTPGTEFFDPTRARAQAYDPARAKTLLAEAGHPKGFSTSLLSTAQYGMHKDTAEIVQQNLAAIGIQVELKLPDWATRVTLGNRGQYEFAVGGTASDSNDPDGMSAVLDGTLPPSYTRSVNLPTPRVHDLLAAGRAEFDPAKRRAIYNEMQDVALEQAGFVGLAWRSQGYAMSSDLKGFHNLPGSIGFFSGYTLETAEFV